MTIYKKKFIRDYVAYSIVKFLRTITDLFFKKRYSHRAVMLETIAGVPGMVGAMLQHLKSLRTCKTDNGLIRELLEEAENERMHLMIFIEISRPNFFDRFLIIMSQMLFFISYFLLYIISPYTAHKIVAYLEEEAVKSYSFYLEEVESGIIENIQAPTIAIKYWNLPESATLKELIIAVREDEMKHQKSNHIIAENLVKT